MARIRQFNIDILDLEAVSDGPMSSIEMQSNFRLRADEMIVEKAQSMSMLPWHEVYGLNFNDVWKLPERTYRILRDNLIAQITKSGDK